MDVDPFPGFDLTNRPPNPLTIFDHRPPSGYLLKGYFVSKRDPFLCDDLLVFREYEEGSWADGRFCCGHVVFWMAQNDFFKIFLIHDPPNIQEFQVKFQQRYLRFPSPFPSPQRGEGGGEGDETKFVDSKWDI